MESDSAIEAMVADLVEQGIQLVTDSYSAESFGDWLREFHSPDLWIRVVRERGQWSVEAAPSGSTRWFSFEAWAVCVEGVLPPDNASPARFSESVRASVPRLRAAVRADNSLVGRLERAGQEILARHLTRVPKRGFGATAVLGASASSSDVRQEAARRLAQEKLRRRKQRS
jgi:hypothetical protein